jgi:5'-nucleotidase
LLGLKERFDLVISGINRGFNLGKDIVYSGTAGAIFEGARLGIPGIAFSTDPKTLEGAKAHLDRAYRYIVDNNLFAESMLFNVNMPDAHGEIRITKQGGIYFRDEFTYIGNDIWEQGGYIIQDREGDPTLDTDSIRDGYVSITPLIGGRTNYAAYEKIIAKK